MQVSSSIPLGSMKPKSVCFGREPNTDEYREMRGRIHAAQKENVFLTDVTPAYRDFCSVLNARKNRLQPDFLKRFFQCKEQNRDSVRQQSLLRAAKDPVTEIISYLWIQGLDLETYKAHCKKTNNEGIADRLCFFRDGVLIQRIEVLAPAQPTSTPALAIF